MQFKNCNNKKVFRVNIFRHCLFECIFMKKKIHNFLDSNKHYQNIQFSSEIIIKKFEIKMLLTNYLLKSLNFQKNCSKIVLWMLFSGVFELTSVHLLKWKVLGEFIFHNIFIFHFFVDVSYFHQEIVKNPSCMP